MTALAERGTSSSRTRPETGQGLRQRWERWLTKQALAGHTWQTIGDDVMTGIRAVGGPYARRAPDAAIKMAAQQYVGNVASYRAMHPGLLGDDLKAYLKMVVSTELQRTLADLGQQMSTGHVKRQIHPEESVAGPCPRCEALSGIHSPDDEDLWYWHPNCNCTWTPVRQRDMAGFASMAGISFFTDKQGKIHPITEHKDYNGPASSHVSGLSVGDKLFNTQTKEHGTVVAINKNDKHTVAWEGLGDTGHSGKMLQEMLGYGSFTKDEPSKSNDPSNVNAQVIGGTLHDALKQQVSELLGNLKSLKGIVQVDDYVHPDTGLKAGDTLTIGADPTDPTAVHGVVKSIDQKTGNHVIQWDGQPKEDSVTAKSLSTTMQYGYFHKTTAGTNVGTLPPSGTKANAATGLEVGDKLQYISTSGTPNDGVVTKIDDKTGIHAILWEGSSSPSHLTEKQLNNNFKHGIITKAPLQSESATSNQPNKPAISSLEGLPHPQTGLKVGDKLDFNSSVAKVMSGTVKSIDQANGDHGIFWESGTSGTNIVYPLKIFADLMDKGAITKTPEVTSTTTTNGTSAPHPDTGLAAGDAIQFMVSPTVKHNGVVQDIEDDGTHIVQWEGQDGIGNIPLNSMKTLINNKDVVKVDQPQQQPATQPQPNPVTGLKVGDKIAPSTSVDDPLSHYTVTSIDAYGAHTLTDYDGVPWKNGAIPISGMLENGTYVKVGAQAAQQPQADLPAPHPITGLKVGDQVADSVSINNPKNYYTVIKINENGSHVLKDTSGKLFPISAKGLKGMLDTKDYVKVGKAPPTTTSTTDAAYVHPVTGLKVGDVLSSPLTGEDKFKVVSIDPNTGKHTVKELINGGSSWGASAEYLKGELNHKSLIVNAETPEDATTGLKVGPEDNSDVNAGSAAHPLTGLKVGDKLKYPSGLVATVSAIDDQGIHTLTGFPGGSVTSDAKTVKMDLDDKYVTKVEPEPNSDVSSVTGLKIGDTVAFPDGETLTLKAIDPQTGKHTFTGHGSGNYSSSAKNVKQDLDDKYMKKVEQPPTTSTSLHPVTGLKVGDKLNLKDETPFGTVKSIAPDGTHTISLIHGDSEYSADNIKYYLDSGSVHVAQGEPPHPITGLKVGDKLTDLYGKPFTVTAIDNMGYHTLISDSGGDEGEYNPSTLNSYLSNGTFKKVDSSQPAANVSVTSPGGLQVGDKIADKYLKSDAAYHWTLTGINPPDNVNTSYTSYTFQDNNGYNWVPTEDELADLLKTGQYVKVGETGGSTNALTGLKVGDKVQYKNGKIGTVTDISSNGTHSVKHAYGTNKYSDVEMKQYLDDEELKKVDDAGVTAGHPITGLKVGDTVTAPKISSTSLLQNISPETGVHTFKSGSGKVWTGTPESIQAKLQSGELQKTAVSISSSTSSSQGLKPSSSNPLKAGTLSMSNPDAKYFSDDDEGVGKAWANTAFADDIKNLTYEEVKTLGDYRNGYYTDINETLLGHKDKKSSTADRISSIDGALKRSVIQEPVVVFRGVSSNALDYKKPSELVGTVYKSPTYLSTSVIRGKSFSKTYKMVITLPAGTHGLWLEGLDDRYDYNGPQHDETEILLPRNLKLHVDGVNGNDIYMTVILSKTAEKAAAKKTKVNNEANKAKHSFWESARAYATRGRRAEVRVS